MTDAVKAKQPAHDLIDQPGPVQFTALVALLQSMVDPLARKLAAAPVDDEPFTNEDRHLNAEANDGQQRQEPISLEEVLADFGLTIDDWERMGRTPLPQTTAERNGSPGAILF